MTPQTQKVIDAAKAVSRLRFISHPFVVLREAITAFEQSQQEETKLDKLAEKVLREYVEFEDVNGSKTVNLLPLTIVDMMIEFVDRIYEDGSGVTPEEFAEKRWKESQGEFSITDFIEGVHFYYHQTASKDKEIAELKAEAEKLKKDLIGAIMNQHSK